MGFGDNLKSARLAKGYTQSQLAELIGVAKSTLAGYEGGGREPDVLKIKKIAAALGVTGDDLLGLSIQTNNNLAYSIKAQKIAADYDKLDAHGKDMIDTVLSKELDRIEIENKKAAKLAAWKETQKGPGGLETAEELALFMRPIPLYDLSAAAGNGIFLDSEYFELVDVGPEVPPSATFGVRISGDSMEPNYPDGYIAWVRQMISINNGQIGVFVLNGNGYVKKQGHKELISLNPEYKPIKLNEDDDIRTCGLVVGVTEDIY